MYDLSEIQAKYRKFLLNYELFLNKEWESMSDDEKAEYRNCFTTFTKLEFAVQASANHQKLLTQFTKVGF